MANAGNQKLKLLYIMEIFLRETDEHHSINASEIVKKLAERGIVTERKSVYRDIDILVDFGMDIVRSPETKAGFYLAGRTFELPELKLLADAVAASKFITDSKSAQLEKKIEQLASRYEAKQLQRQVVVSDRVKTENEKIYYAIDVIYNCIDNNHQMEFQYSEWTVEKKRQLRKNGAIYRVSPEFLLWDNEYYYLVAFDELAGAIRHYRVDKMENAKERDEARGGVEARKNLRRADYARKPRTVVLYCKKELVGVMLDRFGTEASVRPEGKEEIALRTEVEVSPQFFGWLAGLGDKVRIQAPADVAESYREYLRGILSRYEDV